MACHFIKSFTPLRDGYYRATDDCRWDIVTPGIHVSLNDGQELGHTDTIPCRYRIIPPGRPPSPLMMPRQAHWATRYHVRRRCRFTMPFTSRISRLSLMSSRFIHYSATTIPPMALILRRHSAAGFAIAFNIAAFRLSLSRLLLSRLLPSFVIAPPYGAVFIAMAYLHRLYASDGVVWRAASCCWLHDTPCHGILRDAFRLARRLISYAINASLVYHFFRVISMGFDAFSRFFDIIA